MEKLSNQINSLEGLKVQGPKRKEVEDLNDFANSHLKTCEKIAFYENMISENLTPNGKDSLKTMRMIVSSTSSTSGKVDKIVDFFESVGLFI